MRLVDDAARDDLGLLPEEAPQRSQGVEPRRMDDRIARRGRPGDLEPSFHRAQRRRGQVGRGEDAVDEPHRAISFAVGRGRGTPRGRRRRPAIGGRGRGARLLAGGARRAPWNRRVRSRAGLPASWPMSGGFRLFRPPRAVESANEDAQPDRLGVEGWWPRAESNHRHKDFQSSALPTELLGRSRALYQPRLNSEWVASGYSSWREARPVTERRFETVLGIGAPWYVASADFDAQARTLTSRLVLKAGSRAIAALKAGAGVFETCNGMPGERSP